MRGESTEKAARKEGVNEKVVWVIGTRNLTGDLWRHSGDTPYYCPVEK